MEEDRRRNRPKERMPYLELMMSRTCLSKGEQKVFWAMHRFKEAAYEDIKAYLDKRHVGKTVAVETLVRYFLFDSETEKFTIPKINQQ